jgi:biotin operon repressor
MNEECALGSRLAPEMASFRLLVYAYVREYIGLFSVGPSYGEISAKFACSRTRARDAAKSLERDGMLIRTPGPRGLRLPSVRDVSIRELRALGWVVDEDVKHVGPPAGLRAHSTLLPPPELDYPSRRTEGIDGEKEGARKAG